MTLSTRSIVIAGVLAAVSFVLAITGLGYFPVPNLTAQATIMHVPAIIGGVLEGPLVGAIVGLVFGIDALIRFSGLPFFEGQPVWMPVLILLVPRLFIGPVAWLLYKALQNRNKYVALSVAVVVALLLYGALRTKNEYIALSVAAAVALLLYWALRTTNEYIPLSAAAVGGTLANTVLVLGLAILFQLIPAAIFVTALPQAVFESVIAAVITVAVVAAWKQLDSGRGGSSI